MVKSASILFGIVFLAVGILGFVPGITNDEMLLGIFHVNLAHNIVHVASGVVFLLCGMAGAGPSSAFLRSLELSTRWLQFLASSKATVFCSA
jgi:Domain of unknown function (DUF4383)